MLSWSPVAEVVLFVEVVAWFIGTGWSPFLPLCRPRLAGMSVGMA